MRSGRYGTNARRKLAARLMIRSSLGRDRILNVSADSERDLALTDASIFWKGSERKRAMDLALDEYRVVSFAAILSSHAYRSSNRNTVESGERRKYRSMLRLKSPGSGR